MSKNKKNKKQAFEEQIRLDALGIKSKISRELKFNISIQTFYKLNLLLLILIVTSYFLYTNLLLPLLVVYGLLFFIAKDVESSSNHRIRKANRKYVFKWVYVLVLIVCIISVVSTVTIQNLPSGRSGFLEGKTEEEIGTIMEERGISESRFEGIDFDRNSINKTTILEKVLSLNSGSRNIVLTLSGDANYTIDLGLIDGTTNNMPGGGMPPDMQSTSEVLNQIPFEIIFKGVITTIVQLLLLIAVTIGFVNLGKIKELE